MPAISKARALRLVEDLGSRKAAARVLGVHRHWFTENAPGVRACPPRSAKLVAALHRHGLPLEQAAAVCEVSIRKAVLAIQSAERAEIARIRWAGECAAWRTYKTSLATRWLGA